MPLKVKRWYQKGDQVLPEITDDRDQLPVELVKQVQDWLESRRPEYLAVLEPTHQLVSSVATPRFLINPGGPKGERIEGYSVQPVERQAGGTPGTVYEFEAGTFEVLHKDKGIILRRYDALYARCVRTNLMVYGSILRCRENLKF